MALNQRYPPVEDGCLVWHRSQFLPGIAPIDYGRRSIEDFVWCPLGQTLRLSFRKIASVQGDRTGQLAGDDNPRDLHGGSRPILGSWEAARHSRGPSIRGDRT